VVSQLLPPAAVTCEHVDNENIIDKPSFSTWSHCERIVSTFRVYHFR
jgi:hypothetical protein